MEKLTPNRFGEEKLKQGTSQKTGKPYSFKTIGFVSNEYPDRWYNINYNDKNPLELGKTYDLEITSREYNGKTYYDAKLPQKIAGDVLRVEVKLDRVLAETQIINGILSDMRNVLGELLQKYEKAN